MTEIDWTSQVHTVETEDILVGGFAENCAHCIVEHIGEIGPRVIDLMQARMVDLTSDGLGESTI